MAGGGQASRLGGFHSVDFIFVLALAKRTFLPGGCPVLISPKEPSQ